MLVTIATSFDLADRRYIAGQDVDVDRTVALRWIADGKATTDANNAQNPVPDAIQALVSKAGITADDTGTVWLACPKLLSLSAVLTAGTATTVLIEVRDAAQVVTTAVTLTLDTISQILRTAFLTRDAVDYRIRRASGTGTVTVTA